MNNWIRKNVRRAVQALGFDVVRLGSVNRSRNSSMPTWSERVAHAKSLGFSPSVILDGGAFHGLWAVEAAQIFPRATIVLVEPNPAVHTIIESNTAPIVPAPILVRAALGKEVGQAKLNIWREQVSDTGASLLTHVSGEPSQSVAVPVETIDQICQRIGLWPDLIKLDLQGAELPALEGGKDALIKAEMVLVEFGCLDAYVARTTPRELMGFLYEFEFGLYDIVECHYRPYDGALTGGDFIFVKHDSILRRYKGWE